MPVGILDAATEVKMKQDAQAAQEAQSARSEAGVERRFDIQTGMQKENTAWTRSQDERKTAEEQRRFDLSQQASARAEQRAARAEQRADRQLSLQEFGTELSAMRFNSDMDSADIGRQKSRAQLDQYLAATEEEKQARANRERIAKGAFGSLIIAGRLNGGIIPTKALAIANQELGDKDTQIVGGGFDEQTGIAFFNVKNLKDGSVKQLNMTPENQYAAIHGGIGKHEADMFYETFKTGSAARAGIERKRLEYQEKEAYDLAKEQARLQAERSDPIKQAEMLEKQADSYLKRADITNTSATKEQRDIYRAKANEYFQRASDLRDSAITGGKQQQKPFALTPEIMEQYDIPQGARVSIDPRTGNTVAYWYDENKKTVKLEFDSHGKAIEGAPQPPYKPTKTPYNSENIRQIGQLQDNPTIEDFAKYGIKVTMDENGVIKSAVSGNDITGYRDIPLKDVVAEYEKRRKLREDKLARKEAEKKAEEAEKKAERARLEKINRDYESSFGKGKL